MSNATEQARSTRSDARAFADAFSAADDAFAPDAGESRTLTLAELGEALAPAGPRARPVADAHRAPQLRDAGPGDDLITLDELAAALTGPAPAPGDVEFDFGTSAHERARRRTAARLEATPAARRRISGPAARRGEPSSRPAQTERFARGPVGSAARVDAAQAISPILRPSDDFLADPDARRTLEITGRPDGPVAPARLREVQRDRPSRELAAERFRANPDRIAMWAVLLGILLVLIAVTSGSASAVALPLLSL